MAVVYFAICLPVVEANGSFTAKVVLTAMHVLALAFSFAMQERRLLSFECELSNASLAPCHEELHIQIAVILHRESRVLELWCTRRTPQPWPSQQ